ncbi:hypothetical protein [Pseudalkalibacillus decolorationis]|uniref:hypothetical protein n=1 Tax=Pseudalkalibacillus decolorationis TaxID=163879 RepID=UPI0021479724|nr:hypothetical protein [Pseudalkalibacillus decolorationis]
MKNRILLSLLLALALVYFAVPYLPEMGTGLNSMFSFLWLAFAFLVIGGNFSTLLFGKVRANQTHVLRRKRIAVNRKRIREY